MLAAQIRERREEAARLDRILDEFDREAHPDDLYGALTRDWGHEYARAVEQVGQEGRGGSEYGMTRPKVRQRR